MPVAPFGCTGTSVSVTVELGYTPRRLAMLAVARQFGVRRVSARVWVSSAGDPLGRHDANTLELLLGVGAVFASADGSHATPFGEQVGRVWLRESRRLGQLECVAGLMRAVSVEVLDELELEVANVAG